MSCLYILDFYPYHSWNWKSLSCIWLFATPWTVVLNSPGQNTGAGSLSLLQGSPQPRDQPRSPALQADSLPAEPQWTSKNTRVGSLSLLQQIFPTQELNQGLLHCRQILYQLSSQGSPSLCKHWSKSGSTNWKWLGALEQMWKQLMEIDA